MSMAYKSIPVSVAKAIAEGFDKSQVIVIGWDHVYERLHVTTYGVTAFDKENAAAAGEKCNLALGGDLNERVVYEDFHRDMDPANYKESLDLLEAVLDLATMPIENEVLRRVKSMLVRVGRLPG